MFGRVVAAVLIVATALALLIAAWPQLFGLQTAPVAAQVVGLRGAAIAVAAAIIVVLLLLALAARRLRRFASSLALVGVVFVVISAIVMTSRGFGSGSFETPNDATLTVLSWNTLGEAPGAKKVASLAIDLDADVVVLPEATSTFAVSVAGRMAAAGHPMTPLTWAYDEISKSRSTSVLISSDLGEYEFDSSSRTTKTLPSIVARPVDGSGPTIIAVHPISPVPGELATWRSDLRWLEDACHGKNVIMAGDFNATADHLAGLSAIPGATVGDCFDSAIETGNGSVGTWPTNLPALLGAPIDHVMHTSNWRSSGMRVIQTLDDSGSDHRPVVAQLTPAG